MAVTCELLTTKVSRVLEKKGATSSWCSNCLPSCRTSSSLAAFIIFIRKGWNLLLKSSTNSFTWEHHQQLSIVVKGKLLLPLTHLSTR